MNTSNSMGDLVKAKFNGFKEWFFRHAKIVMPVVLLVCVVITVLIAVNANGKKQEQDEEAVTTPKVEVVGDTDDVPEVPLEKDAVPEINELFNTLYTAMVEGDTDTMERLERHLDATEILRAKETSKYIESYPTLEIYTKVGPKEGSYIAYVYSELKFKDYDKPIPGMTIYYVCTDENGNFYVNQDGEGSESEINYIRKVNLQDDVVDLNNKAAVAYNDMVDADKELAAFIVDLNAEIDKNVGEALARAEGNEQTETGTDENGEGEDTPEADSEPAVVVTKVKATDVVNIRTSDSETADKLGKAAIGDEFTLIEERGNGWSKVEYDGGEAFIKSDYLEPSETQVAEAGNAEQETGEETQQTEASGGNTSQEVTGTVTVKENVRIRSSASETAEKLGTAYMGDKLDLIMKQADGWTKIRYKGQTAYVKSDYVE